MSFLYEADGYLAGSTPAEDLHPETRRETVLVEPQGRVSQESRNALSESLRIAAETNQLAQTTAEELQLQTEQIQRIHRDSELTQNELKTSEFLLKGMKGWWSSFTQLFQEPPQPKAPQEHRRPPSTEVPQSRPEAIPQASTVPAATDDMSTGLVQLSHMLEEMKHRAIVTGRELEYQNQELGSIQTLTQTNDAMLDKQRKDLEKLMR